MNSKREYHFSVEYMCKGVQSGRIIGYRVVQVGIELPLFHEALELFYNLLNRKNQIQKKKGFKITVTPCLG